MQGELSSDTSKSVRERAAVDKVAIGGNKPIIQKLVHMSPDIVPSDLAIGKLLRG
jgi:hypothetical protein